MGVGGLTQSWTTQHTSSSGWGHVDTDLGSRVGAGLGAAALRAEVTTVPGPPGGLSAELEQSLGVRTGAAAAVGMGAHQGA